MFALLGGRPRWRLRRAAPAPELPTGTVTFLFTAAGAWGRPVAVAEQAVDRWRRIGDRLQMGDGLVWLAVVNARAGRQADARSAIGEALRLLREVDSPMGIVSVILGLSYLARWEGRYQDAVRLAGAAEAAWEEGRRLSVNAALASVAVPPAS